MKTDFYCHWWRGEEEEAEVDAMGEHDICCVDIDDFVRGVEVWIDRIKGGRRLVIVVDEGNPIVVVVPMGGVR